MSAKDKAYKTISDLVNRFEEQIDSYKKSDYNETQTRRDFIDPFFKCLGWDVDNENGYAESYREVIHEDKIKIGSATKAPDYSFRLVGGKRLFFVEAKKPSIVVKDDMQPAYQVRRYGWSAKLPISIITDFEEFAIYDCTKKPLPTDKTSVARIQYLTYQDYLKEFDLIWDTFSKEQVLKGSFDKFVKGTAKKKGTATVDKEFLTSLDSWRTYLATSISWNNKDLDVDEINFAVQQTIDRLIFLRIAEDRSVEQYGNLKLAIKQGDFYQNLFHQFQQADEKYNSGLFDFKKDKISKDLKVDNKVLKTIINELYYPESPYEFSVLSVEILGSAYEQFLGKTITLDKAHRAKIEEKPEVRKAGGVYYTPEYIVEYIVKNTVGKLVEGKKPDEVSKIKIVDPACGSGSFLIGAFQYLLDWHKDFYTDKGKVSKGGKNNPLTPEGNLTTSEKKRILLNNIYGVDIDVNAVEVTKLSLLLKCMEGETNASIESQFRLFNERVLPTLEANIKSGNSLIDTDFYDSQLDFGDEKKIKPFNWQKGFPEVFEQGGFDSVIGNPPYVSTKEIPIEQKEYYIKKYHSATGQFDLYGLFIEKAYIILKQNGKFGFITSSTYLNNKDFKNLREILIHQTKIESIINFGETVFEDANLDVTVLIFTKSNKANENVKAILSEVDFRNDTFHYINQLSFTKTENLEFTLSIKKEDAKILEKIFHNRIILSEVIDLPRGIELGSNSDKIINKPSKGYSKLLVGKNIKKYRIDFNDLYIKYENEKSVFKDLSIYTTPKILIQRIRNLSLSTRIVATIDYNEFLCTNTLRIGLKKSKNYSLEFILGLLNSILINYIFLKLFLNKDIYAYQLQRIPVPINPNKLHVSEIEKNVGLLLKLHSEMTDSKIESKLNQIQTKIEYCENKINEIVYQLYDLTPEEIKIVEAT